MTKKRMEQWADEIQKASRAEMKIVRKPHRRRPSARRFKGRKPHVSEPT